MKLNENNESMIEINFFFCLRRYEKSIVLWIHHRQYTVDTQHFLSRKFSIQFLHKIKKKNYFTYCSVFISIVPVFVFIVVFVYFSVCPLGHHTRDTQKKIWCSFQQWYYTTDSIPVNSLTIRVSTTIRFPMWQLSFSLTLTLSMYAWSAFTDCLCTVRMSASDSVKYNYFRVNIYFIELWSKFSLTD